MQTSSQIQTQVSKTTKSRFRTYPSLTEFTNMLLRNLYIMVTRIPILSTTVILVLTLLQSPGRAKSETVVFCSIYLCLSFFQQFFYYFTFYTQVKNIESKWNKSAIHKAFSSKQKNTITLQNVKTSQLLIGDIVLIKSGTVCPADLLILDTSVQRHGEKILDSNERRITGENQISHKKAIRNMNNIIEGGKAADHIEAVTKIVTSCSGQIEYGGPNSKREIDGIFKLRNDPKASRIDNGYILFCGAKLYTEWFVLDNLRMIGMVLYNGKNTKILQKNLHNTGSGTSLSSNKKTKAYLFIDQLSIIFLVLTVAFWIGNCTFLFHLEPEYISFQKRVDPDRSTTMIVLKELCILLDYIPSALYIFFDAYSFLIAFHLEKRDFFLLERLKALCKCCTKQLRRRKEKMATKMKSLRPDLGSTVLKGKMIKKVDSGTNLAPPGSSSRTRMVQFDMSKSVVSPRDVKRTDSSLIKVGKLGQGLANVITTPESLFNERIDGLIDPNEVKVMNYAVMSDLSCIDHVVFDKTDTLTSSVFHVVKISTFSRCYSVDVTKVEETIAEFKEKPELFNFQDSDEEEKKENENYSEKSQEYDEEIKGNYVPDIIDEDDNLSDLFDVAYPVYDLEESQKSVSSILWLTRKPFDGKGGDDLCPQQPSPQGQQVLRNAEKHGCFWIRQ
jgi:magnesium-transporting ATPase (P-type)